ncbi:MAG: PspC domain-containing protein, partial [Nitriliruptorales bacterium]
MNDTTDRPDTAGAEHDPSDGAPRRLLRHPDDRMIAGVAGGLAAYFGIDPAIVRIGFVVLTFAGGSGILAYLLLWLLVPQAESGEMVEERADGDRSNLTTWAGVGLLILGGMLLLDNIGWFGRVTWPLVLVVIGGV